MKTKILLADDSLTIQKVIDITLNNEPFELNICSNEEEFLNKIGLVKPSILLLDFNLSSVKTGFDLVKEAKQIIPGLKVMILFGTFDTVDEEKLKAENIDAHIIKPFDGSKFITLCKVLADSEEDHRPINEIQDEKLNQGNSENLEDQNWELNEQKIEIKTETINNINSGITKTTKLSAEESNQLLKDIEDWGMEVPPIISAHENMDDFKVEFPPVIGEGTFDGKHEALVQETPNQELEEEELESLVYEDKTDTSLTINRADLKGGDLIVDEDPILTAKQDEITSEHNLEIIEQNSNENFWTADDEESDEFESVEEISSSADSIEFEKNRDEDLSNPAIEVDKELFLEEDLNDIPLEIENTNTMTDSSIDFKEITKTDSSIRQNLNENKNGFNELKLEEKDFDQTTILENSNSHPSNIDLNQLSAKVIEALRPELKNIIEEIVLEKLDELLVKGVDSVAWEVIPDLAENLIKDQLQKITDNVLEDQH